MLYIQQICFSPFVSVLHLSFNIVLILLHLLWLLKNKKQTKKIKGHYIPHLWWRLAKNFSLAQLLFTFKFRFTWKTSGVVLITVTAGGRSTGDYTYLWRNGLYNSNKSYIPTRFFLVKKKLSFLDFQGVRFLCLIT